VATTGGDVITADALTPGRVNPKLGVRVLLRAAPLILFVLFALWLGASQANNAKWLDLSIEFMYIAAAAMGVNILLGYTGLLSLGHYGFFVAGGYAGAIFTPYLLNAGWLPDIVRHNSPWFGFLVAFAFGALLGTILALMCCHLRGFYLTVVTLAFGTILPAVVGVYSKQLGGSGGRQVEKYPDTTNAFLARNNPRAGIYYVAVLFLLVTLFLTWNLVRSRWGRAHMAIRESELAARANGVNTYWYKVASFAVSAGIVAVAGWVGALRFLSVSAGSAGDVTSASFRYVVIIVLGGIGTLAGPIVGAIGITFGFGLSFVQDHFRDYQGLLFGVLGLVGVATAPEGAIGNLRKAVRDVQLRRIHRGGAAAARPPVDVPAVAPSPRLEGAPAGDHVPVLAVRSLTKRFGGLAALSELDITVQRETIHALIGPNGSGKSTFVNVITGLYEVTSGSIEFNGRAIEGLAPHRRNRIGIARTFQNLQVWRRMGVLENVMVGAHAQSSAGLASSMLGL
jgi:ABC-type branched-subunit amino acid transport system permease subunit